MNEELISKQKKKTFFGLSEKMFHEKIQKKYFIVLVLRIEGYCLYEQSYLNLPNNTFS